MSLIVNAYQISVNTNSTLSAKDHNIFLDFCATNDSIFIHFFLLVSKTDCHSLAKNKFWGFFFRILKILIWSMTYTISDLITSKLFLCFRVRHSNVFNVCVIFFKVIHFVLQLFVLYGIVNQRFRFIFSIQNGRRNNRKLLKQRIAKIKKRNVGLCYFGIADCEYGNI